MYIYIYIYIYICVCVCVWGRGRFRGTVVATVPAAGGKMMGLEHRHSGMRSFCKERVRGVWVRQNQ